jgi:CubicO group peptidase (beta-lactamase class C family)
MMRKASYGAQATVAGLVGMLLLALAGSPFATAAPGPTRDFHTLDAWVQAEMAQGAIPGLALAIVQDGQVVHLAAFGVADTSGRPVTPQTPFLIESVSKTFTALAVRQQVNAGKLRLDAPVQEYLPWVQVAGADASARITVQHLLDHTSGIGQAVGNADYTFDPRYTLEDLVRKGMDEPLNRPIGTYEYSNLNYLILGLIVQTVAGQPYPTYVQEHIFAPLEMRHSYTDQAAAEQDGLASGYRPLLGFMTPYRWAPNPATFAEGHQMASAEDMGHYLLSYFAEGQYKTTSVVVPRGVPVPTPLPAGAFYDLHWRLQPGPRPEPNAWTGQSGAGFNFNADLLLAPGAGAGVVVLTNVRNDLLAPAPNAAFLAEQVLRMTLGGTMPPVTDQGYYQAWAVIDGILLLMVAFVAGQGIRLRAWGRAIRRPRRHRLLGAVWPVLLNGVLAALMLWGFPALVQIEWATALRAFPDISGVLLGTGLALAAIGGIKTIVAVQVWAARPGARPAPQPVAG